MSFFKRMLQCACATSVPTDGNDSDFSTPSLECHATGSRASPIPFDSIVATVSLSLILALGLVMALWWLMVVIVHVRSFGCCFPDPVRWLRREPKEESDLDRRVKALLTMRKLERHKSGTRAMSMTMPPVLIAFYGWVLYRVSASPASRNLLLYGYIFENGASIVVLISLWALYSSSFPGRLTQRGANVACCVFFVLCSLANSFTQNDMNYVWLNSFVLMGQLMFAMFLASFRILLIPNLVNFLWQLLLIFASDALQPNRGTLLVSLLIQTVFIQFMGFVAEAWLEAEVAAKAREMEASTAVAMAHSLLSAMCDVVLCLQPDLTLEATSPQLNAILFRTAGSLAGAPFQRLIWPEDVQRFEEFMELQCSHPAKADSLHLHLVDSMQQKVAVQLFHTCTLRDDRTLLHMVGISEQRQEQDRFPVAREPSQADNSASLRGHNQPSDGDGHGVVPSLSFVDCDADACVVNLRSWLLCQVMEESDFSDLMLGFSFHGPGNFLSRFREQDRKAVLTSLEVMHAELAMGLAAESQRIKKVGIVNQVTRMERLADLEIVPRGARKPEDAEQSGMAVSSADFTLVFRQRSQEQRRSARSTQAQSQRGQGTGQPTSVVPTLPGSVEILP